MSLSISYSHHRVLL